MSRALLYAQLAGLSRVHERFRVKHLSFMASIYLLGFNLMPSLVKWSGGRRGGYSFQSREVLQVKLILWLRSMGLWNPGKAARLKIAGFKNISCKLRGE